MVAYAKSIKFFTSSNDGMKSSVMLCFVIVGLYFFLGMQPHLIYISVNVWRFEDKHSFTLHSACDAHFPALNN